MSTPQLSYSLLLQDSSNNDVTYLNAGEAATLTLVVSNPGDPVTLNSLTLNVSPGPNATDLTNGSITPVVPAGWTANGLVLTPVGGSVSVGFSEGLTFQFTLTVNSEVGTTQVSVTEVTTPNGTAYPTPWQVAKMSTNFELTGLTASPVQIAPGGTVNLTWTGTPGQVYSVNYFGGPADGVPVTAPPDGSVSWASPAIETTSSAVAFTVSATVQGVTAEASTTVTVNVPQITWFPQPTGMWSYSAPVTLSWTTVNADYCELYANGSPVDLNAPANTRAGGYAILPGSNTTNYTLFACVNGTTTQVEAGPVTVNAQVWTAGAALNLNDSGPGYSLALASDGGTLYASGAMLTSIDTAGLSTKLQVGVGALGSFGPKGTGPYALALSPDGSLLYIALPAGATCNCSSVLSANLAVQSEGFTSGFHLALSPDGLALYSDPVNFNNPDGALGLDILKVITNNVWLNSTTPMLNLPGAPTPSSAFQLSPDGSTLYLLMPDPGTSSAGLLFMVPTGPLLSQSGETNDTITQVASTVNLGLPAMAIAADGSAVYCCAPGTSGGPAAVQPLAIPGYAAGDPIAIFTPPPGATASLVYLTGEPWGLLFAAVLVSGLTGGASAPVGNGLNLFLCQPSTGLVSFVYHDPNVTSTQNTPAIVVDAAGENLYLATGGSVYQFTLTTGVPNVSDAGKGKRPSAASAASH